MDTELNNRFSSIEDSMKELSKKLEIATERNDQQHGENAICLAKLSTAISEREKHAERRWADHSALHRSNDIMIRVLLVISSIGAAIGGYVAYLSS